MSNTPHDQTSPATDADPLARMVRLGQLVDVYGGLLTERQRRYMQLHYQDDLSFGEIARQFNVSRQAIHDAVKHAEASLEEYESKLGLLARGVKTAGMARRSDDEIEVAPSSTVPATTEAIARLRRALDHIRQSGGVIYNTDGLAAQIRGAIDLLEGR